MVMVSANNLKMEFGNIEIFGNVRIGYCKDVVHDPVSHFTSASGVEADGLSKEQKRRKNYFLFPCR